jgi:hypothetical protein
MASYAVYFMVYPGLPGQAPEEEFGFSISGEAKDFVVEHLNAVIADSGRERDRRPEQDPRSDLDLTVEGALALADLDSSARGDVLTYVNAVRNQSANNVAVEIWPTEY